ncbi:MAG: DUF177 domain-containing protein [Bacteroidota bacterium]|nr:DUF177 domain-containing protein [Bacteroidota bacterium]
MQHYNINLNNIKNGGEIYSFQINDSFFKEFLSSEITKADFNIHLDIKKENDKYLLCLQIKGVIKNLVCDLCAEELNIPIQNTTTIILQESKEILESTDEIIYIKPHQNIINLKSLFFEIISLSVPSKRIHKTDTKGDSECNNDMLKLIEKYMRKEVAYDDRWETLKNLK